MILTSDRLVQTEGGNKAARGMGMEQAPHTKQQSADAVISLVSFMQGKKWVKLMQSKID
jgi:hypothetical protein